jgi:hypothetical protein
MRLSRLLSKHSSDAASIQKSNSVNHFNLCATIWKVLLRPKNFVRHFQGPDIKCKVPLSTNNLAFFIVIVILTICHSVHQFKFCEYKGQVLLLHNYHTTASGTRGRLAAIFGLKHQTENRGNYTSMP